MSQTSASAIKSAGLIGCYSLADIHESTKKGEQSQNEGKPVYGPGDTAREAALGSGVPFDERFAHREIRFDRLKRF